MYRQALTKSRSRPATATAPGKRPLPLPVERPMTAPSSALLSKKKVRPDSKLGDPVPSTSTAQPEHQDKTLEKWSSDKQLALTNGVCHIILCFFYSDTLGAAPYLLFDLLRLLAC